MAYISDSPYAVVELEPLIPPQCCPTLSPDGQKIAFGEPSGSDTKIYVQNSDGSDLKQISSVIMTNGDGPFPDPVWSPDGQTLAFVDSNSAIYLVKADGANLTRLEPPGFDPAWSPDGKSLAFASAGRDMDIYVMNSDGSQPRQLTASEDFRDQRPAWSPDGQSIAYVSIFNNHQSNYEIFVMNSDGSNQRRLTDNAANDWGPVFSPDGRHIVFTSDRSGRNAIYVMNSDGSNQQWLMDTEAKSRWRVDTTRVMFVESSQANSQTNATPIPAPAPTGEVVPRILDFTLTPTTALTVGDVITITWQAVAEQAEFCLFSGRPVYCEAAPVSGSRVITVTDALLTEAISGVWLNFTAAGNSTGVSGELNFQCRYDWFFASPSPGCPEAPPVYSRGAAQYFERGLMIWTEQPDRFYVFFDPEHQFFQIDAESVKSPDFLTPPEPQPTPTGVGPTPALWPTVPPPGGFEPVSGFGRVWQHFWRFDENALPVMVRQDLGWATGPEFAFETVTQCALGTAAYHRWTCYVRSPSGAVLSYAPQSTIRDRWFWQEVTAP